MRVPDSLTCMAVACPVARAGSDIDVAASFGFPAPQAFEVLMPPRVDLLVLEHAPLELAGRVAVSVLHG